MDDELSALTGGDAEKPSDEEEPPADEEPGTEDGPER
jgi:hypothetical protein